MDGLAPARETMLLLLTMPFGPGWGELLFRFVPFVLFLELPVYLLILLGALRHALRRDFATPRACTQFPRVTCLVTCYNEGEAVARTITSLAEQRYPGFIEIIPLVDGAIQNHRTYAAARAMEPVVRRMANRSLRVVPKWQRGGAVSSLNLGLQLATGEVVLAVDGDTSFDNDMVRHMACHFNDPAVIGVAGNLRVRNAGVNLLTRLQALEYLLAINVSRVGQGEFGVVHVISGALGGFRRSFLEKMGGYDSGTAQDGDITLRMKHYFGRHPHLRLVFEPRAIGHTDAPENWRTFFRQRQRWDGDLYYLYIRKHSRSFLPRLQGWKNVILQVWTGLYFQMVMPYIIIIYSTAVFVLFPPGVVLGTWAMVYLLYTLINGLLFAVHMALFSERPRADWRLVWLLPLQPLFMFLQRVNNALATLKQMTCSAHLDSSMAPWWVLRKSRF